MPRRGFLRVAAATSAGAILVGCEERGNDPFDLDRPPVPGEGAWVTGEERLVASTCGQCAAGCGIRVRVVEGRAVKVEGNHDCPVNGGSLGPKGQSGLEILYHPDRVDGPRRRVGPRGSGRFEPVAWETAIEEIAGRLRELRSAGHPERLVVLDGEPRGPMHELWARFAEAFGTPNHVDHRSMTDGGKVLAMAHMQGVAELPAYDWARTRYLLVFGADVFESTCQTIHLIRSVGVLRHGSPGQRAKLVQVSPRGSVTAAKADEWVPIEPATYGALALGLAWVLIDENAFDEAFVREHGFGFEEWTDEGGRTHAGFRDLVLQDYSPEKVSRITGVPSDTIRRLAREMVDNRPAVALADGGAAAATNGLGSAMAIHALNALLGNLQRPGGLLVSRRAPLAPWPPLEPDGVAMAGRGAPRLDGVGSRDCPLGSSCPQRIPGAILAGEPYAAGAVFLHESNPVFSQPDGRRWIEALERVPLVVSFSPFADESVLWADFVLPDPTYFERWEVVEPVPTTGVAVAMLRQPVVTPLRDARQTGDVVIQLAKAIGSPVGDAFPWRSYRDATMHRLEGLVRADAGSAAAPSTTALVRELQEKGFWAEAEYPFESWDAAFRTRSGKFEFYSQEIADRLGRWLPEARDDALRLPRFEPPSFVGDPDQFPFVLIAYRGIEYAEGGVRHVQQLRELPLAGRYGWQECVDVNPSDAGRLSLRAGETVTVESPVGSRRLVVRLDAGTRPGTLGLRLGYGEWPPKPGERQQVGGYALLANAVDPLAGIFAREGTRARIRKVVA